MGLYQNQYRPRKFSGFHCRRKQWNNDEFQLNRETKSVGSNQITFAAVKAEVTQRFCLLKSGQTIHIYNNYSDLLNALHRELLVNISYSVDSFC